MQKILYRALKTFLQAALSVAIAAGLGWLNVDVWVGAGVAGVAALLAFFYNLVSDWEP